MRYTVKEIFPTLQGEGYWTGRAAVFVRFSGCNLWSGREVDRASAICQFCDTQFVGGDKYKSAADLATVISEVWQVEGPGVYQPFVVLTGGEPALQVDQSLIDALHRGGFQVAIETNGTRELPRHIDWVTLSPKAGAPLALRKAHEVKLIFPQVGLLPTDVEHIHASHYFLQPMDGPRLVANTRAAIEYCQDHPQWRLSLQTHKMIGIR